ncbi:hypothetical protein BDV96DRAFT_497426 [Lophiotrema nucula]|uniref:Uncharacterized protein n=1 Tax=Lophiotrema nucula TaxID=690887 RepID=A0A6A5Z068_9PLEO|nr:hypothetical protein BDV96DRAFT_497426 [Lophiotrema nucula]
MLLSLASLRTVLFFLQCSLSLSFPHHFLDEDDTSSNDTTSVYGLNTLLPRQGNGKPLLRIMPLGASITQGIGSNPENGYRKLLRDEMRYLGFEVNMVGCQSTGSFNDRQHEGHPSKIISEITDLMSCGLNQKPNLVLINAGTNDCLQASQRASENRMFAGYLCYDNPLTEGVTIILSTLIPNGNSEANGYVNTINQRFRQLIVDYQSQGRQILLAEMNNGFITVGDLNTDGTHPTNEGYPKLAAVWTAGINNVINRNWIVPPINNTDSGGGGQCNPSPDNFRGPVQIQRGSGAEDGTYAHSSEPMGVKLSYLGLATSNLTKNFHFAQIVNAGGNDPPYQADDLVRVLDEEQRHEGGLTQPAVSFRLNTGDGNFDNPWNVITLEQECLNRGVRWGDINGDGLDDFICINLEGKTWASINRGGNPPKFEYIGMIKDSLPWAPQDRIRLGDIDGDGRLDWCAIDDKGDIYCWRNAGVGDAPTEQYGGYWQSIEVGAPTFDAKGQPGIEGVRLIDINGDGRSDWVYVYEDGSTRIFINQRGTHKNTTIHGLKPAWIEASAAHKGFAGLPDIDRDHVKFGRIYASGRADYIRIVDRDTPYQYDFEFYRNTGSGGTKLKGDGVHYCDMYGRGHDDYLWVWSTGMIELYENVDNPPSWNVHNQILDTGRDRKSIHFGDWDGDGLCDVLSVDRDTGNVDMWRNTYSGGSVPKFEYKGQVVGGSRCTQGWGLGLYDLGLRFADIDGDKRVDYLCMEPDTRTTGYLNKASGLQDVQQIKLSTGFDRANHRWADVNGDGRADLMWVDKFSGNVTVWLNDGMKPSAGSSFNWPRADGIWMPGVDTGPNMHFAKISNSGRADFVQVTPKDNLAWVYYNECDGVQNGPGPDDGAIRYDTCPIDPSMSIC